MTDKPEPQMNGFDTRALHAGHVVDEQKSRAVPIYATSSFTFDDTNHAAELFGLKQFGNIYSRLMNPTVDVLEKRIASLEGGAAGLCFASGMAAIQAAICTICHSGQNFVSGTSLYGGTWSLFAHTFKQMGIEVRFFDPAHPEEIDDLVDENTRCVYAETIGNPKWDVPDLQALSDKAHAHGVPMIVDNTSASPALCRPIEHGADVVVHSTTKYLGGHGTHVGGIVIDSAKFKWAENAEKWPEFCSPNPAYHGMVFEEALRGIGNVAYAVHMRTNWLRDTGAAMSPFAAFLFIQGVETLGLRMKAHSDNAIKLAHWLGEHEAVEWVNYPGLESHQDHANAKKYLPAGQGGLMTFGVKGGKEAGEKLVNNVRLISHLANIGDAKSLIIHPASTTHAQLAEDEQRRAGVAPESVRFSVGFEDLEDIQADLDQALRS
jgi:O-acetylhomoserine (thiol)-lyase